MVKSNKIRKIKKMGIISNAVIGQDQVEIFEKDVLSGHFVFKSQQQLLYLCSTANRSVLSGSGRSRSANSSTAHSGGGHKVTFSTEKSEVHEIPPKPKRTPKTERRSKSAPSKPGSDRRGSPRQEESVEQVDMSQRVSITSMDDLSVASSKTSTGFVIAHQKGH